MNIVDSLLLPTVAYILLTSEDIVSSEAKQTKINKTEQTGMMQSATEPIELIDRRGND